MGFAMFGDIDISWQGLGWAGQTSINAASQNRVNPVHGKCMSIVCSSPLHNNVPLSVRAAKPLFHWEWIKCHTFSKMPVFNLIRKTFPVYVRCAKPKGICKIWLKRFEQICFHCYIWLGRGWWCTMWGSVIRRSLTTGQGFVLYTAWIRSPTYKTEFVLDLHCDLQSKNGQLNPNNKALDCLFLGPGLTEPAWLWDFLRHKIEMGFVLCSGVRSATCKNGQLNPNNRGLDCLFPGPVFATAGNGAWSELNNGLDLVLEILCSFPAHSSWWNAKCIIHFWSLVQILVIL